MSRARVGLVGYGYHSPKRTLRGHESPGTAIGEGESPSEIFSLRATHRSLENAAPKANVFLCLLVISTSVVAGCSKSLLKSLRQSDQDFFRQSQQILRLCRQVCYQFLRAFEFICMSP